MKFLNLSILLLFLTACGDPSSLEQTAKAVVEDSKDVFDLNNKDALDDAVMMDKLQVRGVLTYIPNTEEPYNGFAKSLFDDGQLQFLIKFKNGYISAVKSWRTNGSAQTYLEVNELAYDVDYFDYQWEDGYFPHWTEDTEKNRKIVLWHENNQVSSVQLFTSEGQPDSRVEYFENGQKRIQTEMKEDLVWNVKTWKPDGELVEEAVVNGDGEGTIYGENGKIVSKSTFKNGKLDGEQITYNAVPKDIDVATLMDQLMSDDAENRLNALVELGDGRENAAPAIDLVVEVLQDDKEVKVREMAAYVLMMMGEKAGKPALPMLKEALEKERNPTVKTNIISAWSAIDPDSSPASSTPRQP
jgi:antitoxin component YwqK of YwqJK toxin-antitoxin module